MGSSATTFDKMFTNTRAFSRTLCGPAWLNSTASKVDMFEGAEGGEIAICTTTPTTTPTTACANNYPVVGISIAVIIAFVVGLIVGVTILLIASKKQSKMSPAKEEKKSPTEEQKSVSADQLDAV